MAPEGRPATRTNTVALAFCHLRLEASKPKPVGYPKSLKILGDHIRAKRMGLGILQKDVAKRLGTDVFTLLNWEKGRSLPSIRWMPKIIDFLGYAPYVPPGSFEEWFETVRRNLGLSRAKVARQMRVDPGTLRRWLRGEGCPPPDCLDRVRSALIASRDPRT